MNLAFDPKKEQEKPELVKKEEQEEPELVDNQKQQENEAPEESLVEMLVKLNEETNGEIRKNMQACRQAAKISRKYPIDTSEYWLKLDNWI
jgi:hypothetical protein